MTVEGTMLRITFFPLGGLTDGLIKSMTRRVSTGDMLCTCHSSIEQAGLGSAF